MSKVDESDTEEIYEDNKYQIQEQLEKINDAYSYVNCLQSELESCTAEFNAQMASAKAELVALRKRIGAKRIEKATPYYRQLAERARAQELATEAARHYQRSLSELQAAKETLEVAETAERAPPAAAATSATAEQDAAASWEEHLSLARQRVVYAEQELERCRYEHQLHSKQFAKSAEQLAAIKARQERLIEACRPFFELKLQRERSLTQLEERRQRLLDRLGGQKRAHKEAMTSLEAISSDMHMTRRLAQLHRRRLQQQQQHGHHTDQVSISLTADADSVLSDCSEDPQLQFQLLAPPASASVPASPARGRIVSRLGHVTEHPLLALSSAAAAASSVAAAAAADDACGAVGGGDAPGSS